MQKKQTSKTFQTAEPLVGAHTSIAKGIYNSLYQAKELEATTTQIFTANQRQWLTKTIDKEDIKKFLQAKNGG